jgi:16S rRNA (adenine1518-N6/adenine1519-N6)-dimethyltransferase
MIAEIKPLKKFGQNFLQNIQYAKEIVRSLDCHENDIVLEIGAGQGALTDILAQQKCKNITVLEIDSRLVAFLEERYSPKIIVQKKSILDFSFSEFAAEQRVKVLGNIPYHITSQILFKILDNYKYIQSAVLMVQKEVANRLLAGVKSKDYGILTVFVRCHGTVHRLIDITREHFVPVPRVDSTVIYLDIYEKIDGINDYKIFKKIVKTSFQNRRKILQNSLKGLFSSWQITGIESVSLKMRPEELPIEEFKILANEISNLIRH